MLYFFANTRHVVNQPNLYSFVFIAGRQLEMMNIFLGFEQANRYALLDPLGNPVG